MWDYTRSLFFGCRRHGSLWDNKSNRIWGRIYILLGTADARFFEILTRWMQLTGFRCTFLLTAPKLHS